MASNVTSATKSQLLLRDTGILEVTITYSPPHKFSCNGLILTTNNQTGTAQFRF